VLYILFSLNDQHFTYTLQRLRDTEERNPCLGGGKWGQGSFRVNLLPITHQLSVLHRMLLPLHLLQLIPALPYPMELSALLTSDTCFGSNSPISVTPTVDLFLLEYREVRLRSCSPAMDVEVPVRLAQSLDLAVEKSLIPAKRVKRPRTRVRVFSL